MTALCMYLVELLVLNELLDMFIDPTATKHSTTSYEHAGIAVRYT